MYVLRSVRSADVAALAKALRSEDRREILTVNPGKSVEDIIRIAFRNSVECHTIDDGSVLGALGVCPSPVDGFGIVWMLGSSRLSHYRMITLKYATQLLKDWLVLYPRGVGNGVDSRNVLHRRWLELLGFQSYKTQDVHGVLFDFLAYVPEGMR